jgi:DNA polymerase III alpha subunit (gram-positive type)
MHKSFYCVHDCETGGLDYTKNPITQYAYVILDPFTLKEVDRYETFVKPYDDLVIEKQALEHTMVSMSDIKNGITRKKLYETLKTIYTNYQAKGKYKDANRIVSVGHNVPFDHGFIEYVFQSQGDSMWNYFHPNFVDTLVLAKLVW